MGRRACFAPLLLLAACAAAPPQDRDDYPKQPDEQWLSVYVGRRSLDSDYDPVDDQGTLGLGYARQAPGDAVGWELGLFASREKDDVAGTDVEGKTGEVYGGLHKTFGSDVVRPYVGAGVSLIRAEVDVEGAGSDDDSSIAGYVHGGVQFGLTPTFSLGLDLRWLFGSDLEIAGASTDADYGQLAIVLGWSF